MDALDILSGKFYQIHTGTYYGKLPIASSNDSATAIYAQEVPVRFGYEIMSPTSYTILNLVQNLEVRSANAFIKTSQNLKFNTDKRGESHYGYIKLDDGKLYMIQDYTEFPNEERSKSANIGFLPVAPDYVISLIEIENRWGI